MKEQRTRDSSDTDEKAHPFDFFNKLPAVS